MRFRVRSSSSSFRASAVPARPRDQAHHRNRRRPQVPRTSTNRAKAWSRDTVWHSAARAQRAGGATSRRASFVVAAVLGRRAKAVPRPRSFAVKHTQPLSSATAARGGHHAGGELGRRPAISPTGARYACAYPSPPRPPPRRLARRDRLRRIAFFKTIDPRDVDPRRPFAHRHARGGARGRARPSPRR